MKNNKQSDSLLSAGQYWEKKLSIKFETEYIRYKKLCCNLTKQERLQLDGYYFTTYNDWKNYIYKIHDNFDKLELDEYRRFLVSKSRLNNFSNNLNYYFLVPLITSFFIPLLFNQFFDYILKGRENTSNIFMYIFYIIIMFIIVIQIFKHFILKLIETTHDSEIRKSFYMAIQFVEKSSIF